MKKTIKLLSILLIAAQIAAIASCTSAGPEPEPSAPDTSAVSTSHDRAPTTQPTAPPPVTSKTTAPDIPPIVPPITEPTEPTPEVFSLFSDEIRSEMSIKTIPDSEKSRLTDELETLLRKKSYSNAAKEMVRSTGNAILDGQPEFQSLFGFLKPHDTETYFRKYFLDPLDTMVDSLRYCGEESPDDLKWLHEQYGEQPGFSGITNETEKSIAVIPGEEGINNIILTHELYHAATLKEHRQSSDSFYFELLEGSATFYQLTLMGSQYGIYRNLIFFTKGSTSFDDPGNPGYHLGLSGNGDFYYSLYGNKYFKLLALTDFETMDLLLKPDGQTMIRANLVERYGMEGGLFYDQLQNADTFETVLENEARFLRLFAGRMEEIASPEECVSYFHLYRLYRKVFFARYYQSPTENDGVLRELEHDHPLLDYAASDRLMADMLIGWKVLDSSKLTQAEQEMLAFAITARYTADSYDEASRCFETYFNAPVSLLLGKCTFTDTESGDPIITVKTPDGFECYAYSVEGGYIYYPYETE